MPTAELARVSVPARSEMRVLRACWRCGPQATTKEIVNEVQQETLLDYRIIQTLLVRLSEKGYLRMENPSSRRRLFTPIAPLDVVLRDSGGLYAHLHELQFQES